MYTAKQANVVLDQLPDARVTAFYMDVRAFTKGGEEFYDRARARGVRYRRGNPSEVYRRGDKLVVRAEDTLLRRTVEVEADMVVLAVGLEPGAGGDEVSKMLKLSCTRRQFPGRSPSQAASGGHHQRRHLSGRHLPGTQGHPRHGGPGQGGRFVGPHPAVDGHRPRWRPSSARSTGSCASAAGCARKPVPTAR